MSEEASEMIVEQESDGVRLDSFLAAHVEDISRSAFQRLIDEGCVKVNGKTPKTSYKVVVGDVVAYSVPSPKPSEICAEELPLEIVYEDNDILVLNKPRGMVVHPAPGAPGGTLVNALLAHCKGLSTIGGVERPGVVHRLDKDTTGLMVVAKNDSAHHKLQAQIQSRAAERKYLALVWGNPRFDQGIVDAPIGRHPVDRKKMAVIENTTVHRSRSASTEFKVLERFGGFALLEAKLHTGRTHQVRVHAAYAGHPVVGDPAYSGGRRVQSGRREFVSNANSLIDELHGQALHAYSLSFDHPVTGQRMSFTAPVPSEFENLLEFLRQESGRSIH